MSEYELLYNKELEYLFESNNLNDYPNVREYIRHFHSHTVSSLIQNLKKDFESKDLTFRIIG